MTLGLDLGLGIGGPRSGWSPAALGASLLGWWDAERADKLTLSGSSVTTWTDIVGSYAVTQGTAGARPTYSATSFNSRPGITFDGVDDELTIAAVPGTFPTSTTPGEIWALVDQTALVADTTTRRAVSYGDSSNLRALARAVVGGVNRGQAIVLNGGVETDVSDTAVDLSGKHVLRAAVGASSTGISVDGGATATGAVVAAGATSRFRIGASSAVAASNFWQGRFAAVLITSALTASQAAGLAAYLKARGGIA